MGVKQGTCVHLGNCDIGCDVNARNTLDLNYLKGAEDTGAEIRPYHIARKITPIAGGYEIDYDEIVEGSPTTLKPGKVSAKIVVIAAGSLGSTRAAPAIARPPDALPNVSSRLGFGWSSNGDFLTPAIHALRGRRSIRRTARPSPRPSICSTASSGISRSSSRMAACPTSHARGWRGWPARKNRPTRRRIRSSSHCCRFSARALLVRQVMPWFAQARDAADGRLFLENGRLHLDWKINASRPTMNAVVAIHQRLAVADRRHAAHAAHVDGR